MQKLTKAEIRDLKAKVKSLPKLYKFHITTDKDGIPINELSLIQVSRRGSYLIDAYQSQNLPIPKINGKPILPDLFYSAECVQLQEPFTEIMRFIKQGDEIPAAIEKYGKLVAISDELIKKFGKPIINKEE